MMLPWKRVEKIDPSEATDRMCEFCLRLRPEGKIAVVSKSRFVNGIRVTDERRYCKDTNGCVDMAMRWRDGRR